MYQFKAIRAPKSIGLPVRLCQDTHPEYQGIDGSGWFMAARLSIPVLKNTCMNDIRFMLKIDQSLVFYGMLAWYLDSPGTLNPYGVVVTINDHSTSELTSRQILISMGLPYPIQYYRGIYAAVTCQQPCLNEIESSYLDILTSPNEKSWATRNSYMDLPAHWSYLKEENELQVLNR